MLARLFHMNNLNQRRSPVLAKQGRLEMARQEFKYGFLELESTVFIDISTPAFRTEAVIQFADSLSKGDEADCCCCNSKSVSVSILSVICSVTSAAVTSVFTRVNCSTAALDSARRALLLNTHIRRCSQPFVQHRKQSQLGNCRDYASSKSGPNVGTRRQGRSIRQSGSAICHGMRGVLLMRAARTGVAADDRRWKGQRPGAAKFRALSVQ
jgi:hypothetical protein